MGKYTWAYINTTAEATATAAAGVSGSIQFKGESARFDGDANLTFDQGRNQLQLTGTLDVQGDITARNYQLERVTVAHRAGPTSFGNDNSDTHAFTGDITVSDALTVAGKTTLDETVEINKTTSGIAVTIDTDQSNPALSAKTINTTPTQGIVWVDTEDISHANAVGLWVGDKQDRSVGDRLGGATLAKFYSFSNNTDERDLVHIHNKNSSANAAQGLVIENAASPTGNNRDFLVKGSSANRFWVDHEGACLGPTNTRRGKLHVYSNTTDDIGATISINSGQAAADRKPQVAFFNDGTRKFTVGSDGSDSMKFKIGTTAIGTNTFLEANTSGHLTHLGTGTPSNGEVLTYDGSKWVPASVSVQSAKQLINTAGSASVYTNTNIMMHLDTNDNSSGTGGNHLALHDGDGLARLRVNETGQMFLLGTTGSGGTGAQLYLSGSNNGDTDEPQLVFRKTDTAGSMAAGHNLGSIYFQGSNSTKADGLNACMMIAEVATGRAHDEVAETWADSTARGSQFKFTTTDIGGDEQEVRFMITPAGVQVEGRIYGPNDSNLIIASDKNVNIRLDEDNDTSNSFNVINGGGANALTVLENGDTTVLGSFDATTVNVGGGFGSTGVSISSGGNISANGTATVNGTLMVGQSSHEQGLLTVSSTTKDANADVGDPTNYHIMLHTDTADADKGPGIGFATNTDIDDVGAAIVFKNDPGGAGNNAKGELTFYTKQVQTDTANPTRALTIDNTGKVHIGSTNSGHATGHLTIHNTLDPSADTGDPNLYSLMLGQDTNNAGQGSGIGFYASEGTVNVGASIIFDRTDSASKGRLRFYTKQSTDTSADPTEVLRLTDDGKVQITQGEITGPDTGPLYLKSEAGIILHLDEDTGDNSFFRVYNHADQSVFEVNEVGGVGIGLTTAGTAAERLHVKGGGVDIRSRLETNDGYDVVYTGYQGSTQKMSVGYDDSEDEVTLSYGGMANKHMTIGPTGNTTFVRSSGVEDDNLPVVKVTGTTTRSAQYGILHVNNQDAGMQTGDVIFRMSSSDGSIGNSVYWMAMFDCSGPCLRVGGIDNEILLDPFTGGHPTDILPDKLVDIRQGMIVKSTGEVFHRTQGVSNAWVRTEGTTTAKDKAAVGVYNKPDTRGSTRILQDGTEVIEEPTPENRQYHLYNAVGEGQILVTDEGGNIETGDYICSSNRFGHGMLQDDDILHNYTVAKATEPIDFSTIDADPELGFKSVLVACTYHCG